MVQVNSRVIVELFWFTFCQNLLWGASRGTCAPIPLASLVQFKQLVYTCTGALEKKWLFQRKLYVEADRSQNIELWV